MIKYCPSSLSALTDRSKILGCDQIKRYHCLRNKKDELVEKCFEVSWIQKGDCAVYDTNAQTIDAWPCDITHGECPTKDYLSNDVMSYSACVPFSWVTNSSDGNPRGSSPNPVESRSVNVKLILPSIIVPLVLIIAMMIFVWFLRRRNRGTRQRKSYNADEVSTEEIMMLKKEAEIREHLKRESETPLMKMEDNCGNDEEERKKNHLKKEEEHLKFFEYKGESQKDLIQKTKGSLQSSRNVLIIGKPGSGKTTLAWTACKQMHGTIFENKTWYVKASTSAKQLPDKEENTLILLLDGRFENAWTTEGTFEKIFEELEDLRNKLPRTQMRIIATISNDAYERISKYGCITKLEPMDIIDLDRKTNGLTAAEMTTVLNTYGISVKNVTEAKDSNVMSQDQLQAIYECLNYDEKKAKKSPKIGFPLIAALMSLNSPFISNNEFGKEPIKQILESIKRLKESSEHADKNKFFTIVYASFNWGYVDTNSVNKDLLAKIGGHHDHSDAEIDPDFFVLRKRSDTLYEFLHESLLRAFFAAYGSQYKGFVIEHCPLQVLLENSVSQREKNMSDDEKVFFLTIGGIEYEKGLVRRIRYGNVDIRHHRIWEQNGFQKLYKIINAKGDVSSENIK